MKKIFLCFLSASLLNLEINGYTPSKSTTSSNQTKSNTIIHAIKDFFQEFRSQFGKNSQKTLSGNEINQIQENNSLIFDVQACKNPNLRIGLYNQDVKKIAKISANLGNEYLTYKMLSRLKSNNTLNFIRSHAEEIIIASNESKKELSNYIKKNSALIKLSPSAIKSILPIATNIVIEKAIKTAYAKYANDISNNSELTLSEEYKKAYKKNGSTGNFEEVNYTAPISVVTATEVIYSPIDAIKKYILKINTDKQINYSDSYLYNFDKVFGIELPEKFYHENESKKGMPEFYYELAFGLPSEIIAIILAINAFDSYLNQKWTIYALQNSSELINLLEKYSDAKASIDLDEKEKNQLINEYEQKLSNFVKKGHDCSSFSPEFFLNWLKTKESKKWQISTLAMLGIIVPIAISHSNYLVNLIKSHF